MPKNNCFSDLTTMVSCAHMNTPHSQLQRRLSQSSRLLWLDCLGICCGRHCAVRLEWVKSQVYGIVAEALGID